VLWLQTPADSHKVLQKELRDLFSQYSGEAGDGEFHDLLEVTIRKGTLGLCFLRFQNLTPWHSV
jgi:hypothetical protein